MSSNRCPSQTKAWTMPDEDEQAILDAAQLNKRRLRSTYLRCLQYLGSRNL